MDCSMPGLPVHYHPPYWNLWSLLKLMPIQSVMPSTHLLCHPLLLLPLIFPSIRDFSNESVLHMRWPKYLSFSISPFNDSSGLISFRMDWLDLLARPRDSQESSPTPQFKSINSFLLSFLYLWKILQRIAESKKRLLFHLSAIPLHGFCFVSLKHLGWN